MSPSRRSPRVAQSTPAPNERAIALLLFASGGLAVVYEVIWQRQFALVLGSAAPATAAVLAAYFAGLGTGALVVGRVAKRWLRPLRAYAVLEAGVGVGAMLVPLFLSGFDEVYPRLFRSFAGHAGLFLATKAAAGFVALLLPAFCLGGTLPLLGEFVDHGRQRLGLTAGWLYVVNTAGASLGALAVPFLFLPWLGLSGTTGLCAAMNCALALVAWWLDRRGAVPASAVQAQAQPGSASTRGVEAQEASFATLLVPAFISGVATFALQVLWNRAFAQVHENSMYSFAAIVAIVIAALALGAQVARFGLRRGGEPGRLLGGAWVLAGLLVTLGPWLFLHLSGGMAYLFAESDWRGHALHLAGLAATILLAPMALLGTALPVIMEQGGRISGGAPARFLGRILATNVAGSVVGALAAGFVLPRWLGLWNGIIWLGLLVLAAGSWQWTRRSRRLGLILAVGWIVSAWPIGRLDLPRVSLAEEQGERLVAVSEGTHGITAVVERPGSRRLKLNNHYGLGGTASTGDERMQAHIPLLLSASPRRVAFLGLGTGITAGGALFHPVGKVTIMELVPEVVSAARTQFRTANLSVIDDPRTEVIDDDARHFLRGSGEQFDVIVGDLVVPWRQGEGSLFTLEQFTAARRALAPGGLFCQWLPLFQLSETEVNILTRTFLTVFPRAQVWRGDFSPTEPAIALIGAAGDFKPDPGLVRRRLAEMQPDPANPQLRSEEAFWMNYLGVLETSDLPNGEIRINSEDRPWVELLGPRLHAGSDRATLFTGRKLLDWENRLRVHSLDHGGLLPERESSAAAAGGILAEMTLCLAEQDRAGANEARERLRRILPADAFQLLFP